MKKILCILLACSPAFPAAKKYIYAGPHFNYINIEFNNPTDLKGYVGGATAGLGICCGWFFSNAEAEGSWTAGPITGTPCQRSEVTEYFAELKVGGVFSFWCSRFCFQPYTGFGWNRFENEQDPKTAALCYRYDKLFIPLGFYFDWIFCNCNFLGLQFEWRPDVDSCLNLLNIDLDTQKEQAFRVQAPLRLNNNYYRGNHCYRFWAEFVPFFDWNKFGKVEEKNSDGVPLPIPSLIRWSLGLRLIFGAEF